MKAKWRGRAAFAEYAEAAGCQTDEVIAVLKGARADASVMLWSRDGTIMKSILHRGPDSILSIQATEETGESVDDFMRQVGGR